MCSLAFGRAGAGISLPSLMLAALLFNAGLEVKAAELTGLFQKPSLLVIGFIANAAVPVLFIVAVSLALRPWHNPEEGQQILTGLALVAAVPIAGASTAWVQNCGGNLALSIGLVLFTTVLSPLVMPIVFYTAGVVTAGDYSEDLRELASGGAASFLAIWVILPALLGMAARVLAGEQRVAHASTHLKLANYCILLALNYSNASLALPSLIANPDADFLLVMLFIVTALCASAFSSGYLLSWVLRAADSEKASLIFGLGMNNNGAGLVLAAAALADHPRVMLPIIAYNLAQHLAASIVDRALPWHIPPPPPTAEVSRVKTDHKERLTGSGRTGRIPKLRLFSPSTHCT